MDRMREHSLVIVEQALLVSHELIRVAILWHEMWHEGLEEASRLYFTDHNPIGMIAHLAPLHEKLEAVSILSPRPGQLLMKVCSPSIGPQNRTRDLLHPSLRPGPTRGARGMPSVHDLW